MTESSSAVLAQLEQIAPGSLIEAEATLGGAVESLLLYRDDDGVRA